MSRKIKVTIIAILGCVTFTTTAFAGIFDIVGGLVGGVLGVQTTASQEQLENFHKSYLEKSATRVLETGSIDIAFNEMVEEQRKIGSTVKVSEPDADHKIAEISGGNLPVVVKCVVNKKAQTVTISYTKPDGMPTGNVLTKKYELPAGAVAATSSGDAPSSVANQKQTNQSVATSTSGTSESKTETAKPAATEDDSISQDGTIKIVKDFKFIRSGSIVYVEVVFKVLTPINRAAFDIKAVDKDNATIYHHVLPYGPPLHKLETGETYKMREGLPVTAEKGVKFIVLNYGEAMLRGGEFYVRTRRGPKVLNSSGEWE